MSQQSIEQDISTAVSLANDTSADVNDRINAIMTILQLRQLI